ncbi:MAG: tRNA (adenosine(37)-N6)-dimethylallyltransferase MiaA [Candidatus Pseudobacter hemicellulosilyticus]|uniref:tRNA dimethylallyltransferase n=1 Tax=Candidatus Pseudobacter hemicellulosilyticus TaxID=3121375 RepID=A0AAJ6BDW7_9BACT|nr:MAG: tRNA (adenosine(37)-N6)-dimethylallyltransferase MiaA [Pseudobacter sp.]
MEPQTCIVIAGPTASGKTALAVQLARSFNTDIISADSRQCFREMTIGTAKPSAAELAAVQHYFINSHSIQEAVSAAAFELYALEAADRIFQEHPVAVMAGGTGLYIKAFCEGLDELPPIDPAIREQLNARYAENGLGWLQQQVAEQDPVYYADGELLNPQRLLRALEVKLGTGQSIRHFQQHKKAIRDFHTIKIGITLPKEVLHERINQRVDRMMEQGLLEEVKELLPYRHLNALQTVGYNEVFSYLDGQCSLEEAVAAIKRNTRQYAKRQLTWFRRDPTIQWFAPDQFAAILEYCQSGIQGLGTNQ